ncbi:hypothetical protein ACFQ2A_05810 [Variovorax dokdonensis]
MSHRSEVVSEAPTVPLVSAQEMSQGTTQQAAKLAPPAPAEALVEVPVSPPPTGDAAATMNSSKPGPDSAADVKPKPTRKPMARKPAPAPEPVQASPPPVVAPAPPAPPAPQEACAGLNFVAKSRCLVAQCARPEQKAHPQCQAVREQQRLEEEKRNPQLVN